MSRLLEGQPGDNLLYMGNEAIARGALEAGVNVVAGYPGTPSSEIIENLAKVAGQRQLYVEWSVNEKVALEVAAAASFAGLRAMCTMKQVGMNVAADFLLHLSEYGTRGPLVLVSCEDPGALSSTNEGESRFYAKMMEFPLLEPGDFQEAKDMTAWAFELSGKIRNVVMVRSVTRLSHASGRVVLGALPEVQAEARFEYDGGLLDPLRGPVVTLPGLVDPMHRRQQEKMKAAAESFEQSPFNTYRGPEKPELLVITSSACNLYCREAIDLLGAGERVGLLKLGTTWPLPGKLLAKHLASCQRVLVVEEVLPFLEDNVKVLWAGQADRLGLKTFYGKYDGTFPTVNELNPDLVMAALSRILGIPMESVPEEYRLRAEELAARGAPARSMTFCPGCPHRASYFSIHNALRLDNRQGFVCGDIGCYTMGALPCGFNTIKTVHAMGSGAGVASGFGKLDAFGLDQPVMAVCGDSTFFHAAMPALVNAVHNRARMTFVVLDNSGTAMTGFQPHPGLSQGASGEAAPPVDIQAVCEGIGARVRVVDPFDVAATETALLELLESEEGVGVLILRQLCALSPERKGRKLHEMRVQQDACLAEQCGCNRFCTRIFKCPGLIWDQAKGKARIDEVLCVGCGVCAHVCPAGAIRSTPVPAKEAA